MKARSHLSDSKETNKEFQRFEEFTRQLLKVPKEEIKRREAAAKAKKKEKV